MGQNSSTPQNGRGDRDFMVGTGPHSRLTSGHNSPPVSEARRTLSAEWPLARDEGYSVEDTGPSVQSLNNIDSYEPVPSTLAANGSNRELIATGRDPTISDRVESPFVRLRERLTHSLQNGRDDATASRPRSVIARVGTRVRERYSILSQTNEDFSDISGQASAPQSNQFSEATSGSRSTIPRRASILSRISRTSSRSHNYTNPRTRFAPISRPIPHTHDIELHPQFGVADSSRRVPQPSIQTQPGQQNGHYESISSTRQSRLSRVRRSISGPIESLLRGSFHESSVDRQVQNSLRRTVSSTIADDSDYLIPPATSQDFDIHQNETVDRLSDVTERAPIDPLDALLEGSTRALPLPPQQLEPSASMSTNRREGRRLPNLLRGRSSRLIRRDDEAPLSRILQVAAAAIAAQLSGTTDATANLESLNEEHFDGGLNAFVNRLNNVSGQPPRSTQELNNESSPLNFWRVFRFANNQTVNDIEDQPSQSLSSRHENNFGHRTVTIVVVGVRSVPSSSVPTGRDQITESRPEALLTLQNPFRPSPAVQSGNGRLIRSLTGMSPFARRRTSGNTNSTNPSQPDLSHPMLANPEPQTSSSRLSNSIHLNNPATSSIASQSRPQSEPSTSQNQGTRLSEVMMSQPNGTTNNQHIRTSSPSDASSSTVQQNHDEDSNGLRSRRRSDSEANRHLQNGARDDRRHGVVADNASEGRSWLIYVVGTILAADHPALDNGTLFSDVSGALS